MQSKTVPYEIMLRFGHRDETRLGAIETYQFTDATAVLDDGGKLTSFIPASPRDITQDEAVKYLGDQFATFTAQLTAAQQALADAQAKAATDLQAAKDQAAMDAATTKVTNDTALAAKDATIADLTAKLGALPQFIDDLKAAAGGQEKVQALIDDYKQQQAKQNALAQGAAVIDELVAMGLSPDEISQAVANKLATRDDVTAAA